MGILYPLSYFSLQLKGLTRYFLSFKKKTRYFLKIESFLNLFCEVGVKRLAKFIRSVGTKCVYQREGRFMREEFKSF